MLMGKNPQTKVSHANCQRAELKQTNYPNESKRFVYFFDRRKSRANRRDLLDGDFLISDVLGEKSLARCC